MFRRFPYWGWLLTAIVLWCSIGYYYHQRRQSMQPGSMAHAVAADLQRRADAFEKFRADGGLIGRMFEDALSEKEFQKVNALPFYVYCYDRDTLDAWNTNVVIGQPGDSAFRSPVLLKNEKGIFVAQCFRPFDDDTGKRVVVLLPVVILYPLENTYLHARFCASDNIPVSAKIAAPDQRSTGAYLISLKNTGPVFSLTFDPQDMQKWTPDLFFLFLLAAAILATICWVQLVIPHLTDKKPFAGFLATAGFIAVMLCLFYGFGPPFNLSALPLFDSHLYASSKALSSFADLFIDALCLLWLVVFLIRNTPYQDYFKKLKNRPAANIVAAVLIVVLYAYVNLFVYLIHSLVHESTISFDLSHFYSINIYSILGLVVIACLTGITSIIIYLFNVQLSVLIENRWAKYAFTVVAGLILVILDGNTGASTFDWPLHWALYAWLLLFLFLLDVKRMGMNEDLFKPEMVLWSLFVCLSCTMMLQYFNFNKEKESRIAYVKNRLSPHRDYELEFSFQKKATGIELDKMVRAFFRKPSAPLRRLLDVHLNTTYLTDPALSAYQSSIYFFDSAGKSLFNKDSLGFTDLSDLKNESDPTRSPYLFYREPVHDPHQYLGYIRVYSDTLNDLMGYVLIDLDLRKQISGTVYPELLQSGDKAATRDEEYAVGTYVNNRLNSQTGTYPFTSTLPADSLKKEEPVYHTNGNSALYYKLTDRNTLVVVYSHNQLIEIITLFSYLFVIQVLLAALLLFYHLVLSLSANTTEPKNPLRRTIRQRVHFSMLGIVFSSFIFIGVVTIWYFYRTYHQSNTDKLQSALQLARESLQSELKKEHAFGKSIAFDSVSRSARFKSIVTSVANGQKIDINIYNAKGALVNTSEDDIYEKGLIARIMRPDAYYQLHNLDKSILIEEEKIAGLSYLSAYLPLRDEQGAAIGYINVPFFSSEKDLSFQVSSVVVSLINIYAFVFLLSSLLTVVITRWITKSFQMITNQFARVNLEKNERIQWANDDEIGQLVKEYNKMVEKVEAHAAKLARSERESAWREMARQVAHEIKNPLTPMKLNIQYLRQAMANDAPNVKELTEKVSCSIIEQIDNLSYIASEFSNFATMPEARPEVLEPAELLSNAVKLYPDDAVKVTLSVSKEQLKVWSDRSQLLRVFTNLLENAKQAIPATRAGIINVSIAADNGYVLISVNDNGTGINDKTKEKIFQPYFTTKSSGTGLGLAMTKKIIEFWKGHIWFETKEDEGTTFFIKLPLARGEDPMQQV